MKHGACLVMFLFVLFSLLAPICGMDEKEKADVYKIVGTPNGRTEYLPASYAKSFPRWQVSKGGELIPISTEEECNLNEAEKSTTISIQPTINFLLRKGVPTYLFVGLWASDEKSPHITSKTHHWAQQWTAFDQATKSNFHVEVWMGPGNGSTDRRLGLVEAQPVKDAVEQLGIILATTQEQDLAEGYQILSIPLKMDTKEEWDMDRSKGGLMMLTSVATGEADVGQLLSLDKSDLEQTGASRLQVEAFQVLSSMV